MTDLVTQYLSFFSRPNASSTVNRVKYQLHKFTWHLHALGVFSCGAVRLDHVTGWLSLLKEKGMSGRYLHQYACVLRGFFNWLLEEGFILVNPLPEDLDIKQKEYTPRAFPSPAATRLLLQSVTEGGRCPLRNRAIMELCYGAGLRRGELHHLNVSDIRSDWLKVRGKGDRERLVPLGTRARQWIGMYMRTERLRLLERFNPLEEALFLNQRGSRLGIQSYSYLMTYKRPEGKSWTLHSLRHACATHMLANGANVRVLQKLLGHKNLSSTQVYTRVEVSSLRKLLSKYHPRG